VDVTRLSELPLCQERTVMATSGQAPSLAVLIDASDSHRTHCRASSQLTLVTGWLGALVVPLSWTMLASTRRDALLPLRD